MEKAFDNVLVSRAIIDTYHEDYRQALQSDVLITGAGPSGLMAAVDLARGGCNVTIIERKLMTGGGIPGGGMTMSRVAVQEEALPIMEDLGVRTRKYETLYVCDSVELAAALTLKAIQSGARILNTHTVEDLCMENGKVVGLVVNKTGIYGVLHVDPLMFHAKVVLDSTGHDMALAKMLQCKVEDPPARKTQIPGEGPMDAWNAEKFVVDNSGRYYPGLYLSGMAVCAAFGGPRMGPIFGGMLLSGRKVAQEMMVELGKIETKSWSK